MAIDVLRLDSDIRHSPIHDVESLLYILIWISCVQGGPRRQFRKDGFNPETSFLKKWCPFKNVDDTLLDAAADAKFLMMTDEQTFEKTCKKAVHVYFKPLISYFGKIRSLLFPARPAYDSDTSSSEDDTDDFLDDDKWTDGSETEDGEEEEPNNTVVNTVQLRLSDVIVKVRKATRKHIRIVYKKERAKAKREAKRKATMNFSESSVGPASTTQEEIREAKAGPIAAARSHINGMKLRNIQRVNYGPYMEFTKARPQTATTGQPLPKTVPHSAPSATSVLKSAGKRTLEGALGRTDPYKSEASTKRLRPAVDKNGVKLAENAS